MLDDASFGGFIIFLLVFARITGAIVFNPLLGRKNIPAIVRVGLSIALTLCVYPLLDRTDTGIDTTFEFVFAVLKELFVGFTTGYIMQLVIASVFTAGESVDMQLGIGMSKIYDPSSNIAMALSGTIYNLVMTVLFFSSNGHLTLIRLICRSCLLFPVGVGFINFDAGKYIVPVFGDMLLLALKIAMPIIAAELLTEAGLGILMRSVSHINIFSIGLHLRLVVGFIILVLSLPAVSRLLDNSITYMFDKINTGIEAMLTP